MACKHCGSDCKAVSNVPEMPFEDFAPVLDEIKLHQPDIKTLVFTVGGEPLVRKDIVECGRKITEKGFLWGMVSNGKLIDASMMKELSKAGLRSLAVDVDGTLDGPDDTLALPPPLYLSLEILAILAAPIAPTKAV